MLSNCAKADEMASASYMIVPHCPLMDMFSFRKEIYTSRATGKCNGLCLFIGNHILMERQP